MIGKGVNFTCLKYANHYMSAQCLQKMEICPRICFFSSKQRIYAAQSTLLYEDLHCHIRFGGDK